MNYNFNHSIICEILKFNLLISEFFIRFLQGDHFAHGTHSEISFFRLHLNSNSLYHRRPSQQEEVTSQNYFHSTFGPNFLSLSPT